MPLVTNVVDDKSPLIMYDATWLAGTVQDDSFATDYYLGTFTTNNVTDGLVTFTFNGTAVWIYGANRPNHGSYTVQVDSQTYSGFNGAGNDLFQQSLFNISTLSQEMHTIKLTNTASGSLYVDIDMIVWQSQVGSINDKLAVEVVQDTDSRFQYQEPAWGTTSSVLNFGLFNNGTGHVTQTYQASVTFDFTVNLFSFNSHIDPLRSMQGEAVSLFGVSGPSNGPYSAQLDGAQTVQYNASNAYPTNYGVMIYHADNLGPGSHQLVLTNLPATSGQSLSIDYVQLWTIPGGTSATTTSSSPNPSSPQNTLSSGAIAGIVVTVVVAILSVGAAFFFYRRWKAAMATQRDLQVHAPQHQPQVSSTLPPSGFSSSLDTRSNTSFLRNTTSTQAFYERTGPPANSHAAQQDGTYPIASATRSIIEVSSPTLSAVDENAGRRPLPEAPGGGLSLADEFPKLANSRPRRNVVEVDRSSIAVSEAPPDYTQAIGNVGTSHGG